MREIEQLVGFAQDLTLIDFLVYGVALLLAMWTVGAIVALVTVCIVMSRKADQLERSLGEKKMELRDVRLQLSQAEQELAWRTQDSTSALRQQ